MARLTASDVHAMLHERIVAGTLRPGDRLREAQIAAEMGVSRTPVREALRRLEGDGLVAHEAHKGAVVRQLDYRAVTELYAIREVLEGTSAALAARHMSETEIDALEDIVEAGGRHRDDAREAARLNKVFHTALCTGAHNRYLVKILDQLALAMALLGPTTLGMDARRDAAVAEHRAILAAVRARDAEAAEAAARAHIRAAQRARLKLIAEIDSGGGAPETAATAAPLKPTAAEAADGRPATPGASGPAHVAPDVSRGAKPV